MRTFSLKIVRLAMRSRFLQYRLRTFLFVVTAISLSLGWHVRRVSLQQEAVAKLRHDRVHIYDSNPDPIGPDGIWSSEILQRWHEDGIPLVSTWIPDLQRYLISETYERASLPEGSVTNETLRLLSRVPVKYLSLRLPVPGVSEVDLSLLAQIKNLEGVTLFAPVGISDVQVLQLVELSSLDFVYIYLATPLLDDDRARLELLVKGSKVVLSRYKP